MWVWDEFNADAVIELAASRRIARLFVAVPLDLATSPKRGPIERLVELARSAGIDVDALGGDPGWIDQPQWTLDHWLGPVVATGLFDAVHVDVEPHGHPSWETDRLAVIERFLALLSTFAATCGPSLALEADIAHWFDQVATPSGTLDRDVMARVDAVTILAYRNTADGDDGTIALARTEVIRAAHLGRTSRIGQETNPLGSDPQSRKQTFHGWSLAAMDRQLAAVEAAFDDIGTMAGVAIHDATGYAAIT